MRVEADDILETSSQSGNDSADDDEAKPETKVGEAKATPKNLSEPEQKLYNLVVRRFLAVFFPAAEYQVTTRITEVAGHHFKTEGKVLVNPGWLVVYGREAQGEDANLVPVAKDEKVKTDKSDKPIMDIKIISIMCMDG